MAAHNNLTLFFLSFSLLLSFRLARSDLSPQPGPSQGSGPAPLPSLGSGPALSPSVGSGPALSPSPDPETPWGNASSPPSKSTSPVADGPAGFDDADDDDTIPFDLSPTKAPKPNSPVADGPAGSEGSESDSPIESDISPAIAPEPISPVADGPADSDSSESDGPIQFDPSPSLAPGTDINPKVQQICDSTDHPALCLATIFPRLGGHSDIPTIVEIAIRTTAELAKIGLNLASNMADNPRVLPELASIFKDCKDSYDSAVTNFENTIDAFPRRDVGTMSSMLSAVITEVGDCEDAFSGSEDESPFFSVADRLTNMTSNCLALVPLLK